MAGRIRVLILEDQAVDAELMAQELRRAGLDPDWKRVDTESDYLAHLRPELDVILADYRLPGFDAFRALDLLKGCGLDIPFIIVSGAIGEDTAVAAIKQGAADYLLKDRLARLGPAVVQAMDHKRLREEKRRVDEEARLEAQLLDAATDSIFVHDLDGKVVYVNEAACTSRGYSREELMRLPMDRLEAPEYARLVPGRIGRITERGHAVYESAHLKKDGSTMPVEVHARLFESGGKKLILSAARDMSERARAEETLRTSEARYRDIFENAVEGIYRSTPAGKFLTVNPALARMLGYDSPAEMIRSVTDIQNQVYARPKDRVRLAKRLEDGEEVKDFVVSFRRRDGKEIWVSINAKAGRDERGKIAFYEGTIEDITERRLAEEALRESEQRYRTLFLESQEAMSLTIGGKIADVNPAWLKQHGYTDRNEVLGMDIINIIHPDDRRVLLNWRDMSDRDMARPEHLRDLRKDGAVIDVEVYSSKFRLGGEWAILTTVRDITERKRTERALAESEQKYKALFNDSLEAMSFTVEGRIVDVNPAWLALHGFPDKSGVIGMDVMTVVHPDAQGILSSRRNMPDERRSRVYESRDVRRDGTTVHVEVYSSAVTVGGALGILSTIRDVTARRQAEDEIIRLNQDLERRVRERTAQLDESNKELEREIAERMVGEAQIRRLNEDLRRRAAELEAANKELEAFSYSVSHDLRAPLRSIDGFSHALLEDQADKVDAQGKDYLHRVRAAAQRMAELIDDLLLLSRITRHQMHRERTDLSALARTAAAQLQASQPERKVEFIIAPDIVTEGDPHMLRIVLDNLLGNGWKFTGKQPDARIELGMVREWPAEKTAAKAGPLAPGPEVAGKSVFFVRDNGAGFDPAYAGKLFGAFQRLHSTREFPGTGVGLATVQRIIHRHGGSLWAEGEVGKGAAFYFSL